MAGYLDEPSLNNVVFALRSRIRLDPMLCRVPMPELVPFANSFNKALVGEQDDALPVVCDELVRNGLEPGEMIRIATFLAEAFADERASSSGSLSRRLVAVLGHVCGLMAGTMASDLRRLARRDSLTGLSNRGAWDTDLESKLKSGAPIAIAVVDLDGLKQINDSKGHDAGHSHIRKFAADLSLEIRERGATYRIGGDEFAVILQESRLGELDEALSTLAARQGVASFSFGTASSDADGVERERLVKKADERMYEMKRVHKVGASPEVQPPECGVSGSEVLE